MQKKELLLNSVTRENDELMTGLITEHYGRGTDNEKATLYKLCMQKLCKNEEPKPFE